MLGNKFEKELKMIETALQNEQSKKNFKEYIKPLVEHIADKFMNSERVKKIERVSGEELMEAGWIYFDLALRKYKDRAVLMLKGENKIFCFDTYFTWYVRQGIIEYLIREEIIQNH